MSEELTNQESEEMTEKALFEKRKVAAEQGSSDGEAEDEVEEGTLPPALQKAIDAKKKGKGDDEEEVDEEVDGEEEDEEEVDESQDFGDQGRKSDKGAKWKKGDEGKEKEIKLPESVLPKTKNGMLKAVYEVLNKLKKDELSTKYEQILTAASLIESDDEDEDDDEEPTTEAKRTKAAVTAEDLTIDVKDDVAALVEGEDGLTEAFKSKASIIFEAAVQAKVIEEVNKKLTELESEHVTEQKVVSADFQKGLTEKVDGYLTYVVEEWMKENELAIEKGIRSELVEDFMSGLRTLFSEHYIDIPEEKVDMVDDLFTKVDDLETSLDEEINRGVELRKELAEFQKSDVLKSTTNDLADTDSEKIAKLAEGIEYENAEQYTEKLNVLKESYFPKTKSTTSEISETDENLQVSEEQSPVRLDENMSKYTSAIRRYNNN